MFKFFHPGRNVFERDERSANQTFGVVRTEVRQPFVIDMEAGPLQVGISETKQRHSQRSVENFGFDAINVLILDAFGWIPPTRPGRFIALFQMLLKFGATLPDTEAAGNWKRVDVWCGEQQ